MVDREGGGGLIERGGGVVDREEGGWLIERGVVVV